jgi:hypothetical protein
MKIRIAIGLLLGVALVGAGGTARANCLSVEVRLWRYGSSTPTYLVGPKKCVVPTSWTGGIDYTEDDRVGPVPQGTPNGAGFTVWVPLP